MGYPINMGREHRHRHSLGYVQLFRPEHRYCDGHGYVPEHRLVVEKELRIIINPRTHHVHHKNGVKDDNRLENLELLTTTDHRRVESGWIKKGGTWHKPCNKCSTMKEVNTNNFYFRKEGRPLAECKQCSIRMSIEKKYTVKKHIICDYCGKICYRTHYSKAKHGGNYCNSSCSSKHFWDIKKGG